MSQRTTFTYNKAFVDNYTHLSRLEGHIFQKTESILLEKLYVIYKRSLHLEYSLVRRMHEWKI